MNNFKICDICEGTNEETLKKRLEELDSTAEIEVGCQGFCGIGATKSFAIINGIPVIAENEDELIEKIKERLDK